MGYTMRHNTKDTPILKKGPCWNGYERDYSIEEGEPKSCVKSPANFVHDAGMTAAERKEHNAETGGNVQAPQPEGGSRKDSYCARSAGIKKCQNPDENGDCPNDIARRKWKCPKKKKK